MKLINKMIDQGYTVEEAYQDDKLIGWRFTHDKHDSALLFDNDDTLKGIRCGDKFVASYGKEIIYKQFNPANQTQGE